MPSRSFIRAGSGEGFPKMLQLAESDVERISQLLAVATKCEMRQMSLALSIFAQPVSTQVSFGARQIFDKLVMGLRGHGEAFDVRVSSDDVVEESFVRNYPELRYKAVEDGERIFGKGEHSSDRLARLCISKRGQDLTREIKLRGENLAPDTSQNPVEFIPLKRNGVLTLLARLIGADPDCNKNSGYRAHRLHPCGPFEFFARRRQVSMRDQKDEDVGNAYGIERPIAAQMSCHFLHRGIVA